MPFLFAAVLVVLDRPTLPSTLCLGAAGALALHAGHPQLTYYSAVFVSIWCVARLAYEARANRGKAVRLLAALLAGLTLAVTLSAYRLLPIAGRFSARHAIRHERWNVLWHDAVARVPALDRFQSGIFRHAA